MKNTGENLESYVQYVYSKLLELDDYEDVIVSRNVTIKGKSGATNEFDVFYQFQHLNIDCKVVIECKDWNTPVPVGVVRDFVAKLEDIGMGQVIGVMISKSGYQDGALKYAETSGIKVLTGEDLPSISQIVAGIIKKAFLPSKRCVGEPFWTIMECNNGDVSGSYYSININGNHRPTIPLFFSEKMAKFFLSYAKDADYYCVRGVTQYQLKGLLALEKLGDPQFAIFYSPVMMKSNTEIPCVCLSASEVAENYLVKK